MIFAALGVPVAEGLHSFGHKAPAIFPQPVFWVIVRIAEGWALTVSMNDIWALFRRHLAAVVGVLILAVGVAYMLKTTPTTYTEGGTVVFNPPVSKAFPNPYQSGSNSIITTAGVLTAFMMGAQGQQQVAAAGGTVPYQVALVNSYDQEYPNYSSPESTLFATSTDLAGVQRTYAAAMQVLTRQLAARQAALGVPVVDQITAKMIGNPGPLAQPGSKKRSLGGLLVLTVIALFAVSIFLDRHPVRLRGYSPGGHRRAGYSDPARRRGPSQA